MIFKFLIPALCLLGSCSPEKRNIVPGTSLELATERKRTLNNVRYDLYFDIPEHRQDSIPATVRIQFDLKNTAPMLQLDFQASAARIREMDVNGRRVPVDFENEHVLVDKKLLHDGKNSIFISFTAGETALNRNEDYLYTLFVPARAASCFPVFDQPDLKAAFHLSLSVPLDWHAVSNARVVTMDTARQRKRYTFFDTRPTSTYQFAFAAGKFRRASDPKSGMTMYYRETDSLKVAYNLPKIFELHQQSLAWLKDYTTIEYPYAKFDWVLLPAFQFGGMEHPGSIFYRESSLLLEPTASVNEQLRRASLIAHETAHMWFGNLVTMKWFNDVWMKEVFANFMAAKMVEPAFPRVNHRLRFLMAHYPAAYDVDRSQGTHPIQQPLDNLKNAGSVYGAIIYQKAPVMMRNLESLIGEDNFRIGLQDYLASFSYGNASWDDLIATLKGHSDANLDVWNLAWIKSKGMPEVTIAAGDTRDRLQLLITNDSSAITWPQFFDYAIYDGRMTTVIPVEISKGRPPVLLVSDTSNARIVPNFRGRGYGYFRANRASVSYMLSTVQTLSEPEARAGIWMNVWEYVVRGTLDPSTALGVLMRTIGKEQDPILAEYLADKIARIFWQFLTPAQRTLVSSQLDPLLFRTLQAQKDNSLKRILFNCYRDVALTREGIGNLYKFWNDEINIGLELSERDRIQIAFELSLRQADDQGDILDRQLSKITNPDRRSEMQFIMPALSGDPAVRDSLFAKLMLKENRGHEPWVLQALHYLHHPIRANYSLKYLPALLEKLEEVQRTGDIFFPKGWLDGALGQQQSEQAASLVRQYLLKNDTLRPDLRNKVLQSADMLFRAVHISHAMQSSAVK